MKFKIVVVSLLMLSMGAAAFAQQGYRARFAQVTVGSTAVALPAELIRPSNGRQASILMCRLRIAQISWRMDGGTPTSTVGTILQVGDTITIESYPLIAAFRAIRTSSSSGQLDCHAMAFAGAQ
jgi:hypothetical protein